ncbi:MAG: hypothetical protein AAB919_02305 [Patescibacteria group bacterium]
MTNEAGCKPRVLLTPFTWGTDVLEYQDKLADMNCEVEVRLVQEIEQAEGPYDLIIQMGLSGDAGKKRGLEYLRNLRRRFNSPILVVSGHYASYALGEVKRCGANDFMERDKVADFVPKVNALLGIKTAG